MKILRDYLLAGTPFRALIVQGPFSMLAYIGVPHTHWLADMDELQFSCHWGLTFRGPGDGQPRPEGWYWYGWDYGHAGDALAPEEQFRQAIEELPPEARDALRWFMERPGAKQWTVTEVEHDLTEAALSLLESLQAAETAAEAFADKALTPGGTPPANA